MVVVGIKDTMLQISLSAVNLILPTEYLIMILVMLLLSLINGVNPHMETRKLVIKVMIKVGLIELRRTRSATTQGRRWHMNLLIMRH